MTFNRSITFARSSLALSLGVALSASTLLGAGAASAEDAPAPAPTPIATPAPATPAPSADGRYKGEMVCAILPDPREIGRFPLDLIVAGKTVIFSRPLENNNVVTGSELGEGTVDGNSIRLSAMGSAWGSRFKAEYSGLISVEGGTLTGTQAWTAGGTTHTRPCTIAVVKTA